jgi:hypothetical protein
VRGIPACTERTCSHGWPVVSGDSQ